MKAATAFFLSVSSVLCAGFPTYEEAGIVNAASNLAGALAPNTIVTIYGADLATASAHVSQIAGNTLPVVLTGAGTRVFVGNIPGHLIFVSPGQINFLVPSSLRPGTHDFYIASDGRAGPRLRITLAETAPGLFLLEENFVAATKQDGSVVSLDNPARADEVIVLYATGLGATRPSFPPGQIPGIIAPVVRPSSLRVQIGESALPAESIFYVGVCPGFAGLYQINIRMPEVADANPRVRIGFEEVSTPEEVRIHYAPK